MRFFYFRYVTFFDENGLLVINQNHFIMKKLLIFAVALSLSGSLFASNPLKPDKALISEIYHLLDHLPLEINEEMRAEVKFYVDSNNRLQVLTVEAEDPYVRKLLRKRLDDKLVETVLQGNVYKLPLHIKL